MFKSLKGINKERHIKERPESALEKLLKVEEQVHREYTEKVRDLWEMMYQDHKHIYLPLYQSLCSTLPQYTEQDIQSLLLAKANNKYNDNEAQVLGMYTGVLLHILTERTEKEKRKAAFTFDLLGNEFNYLFYFAKRVGEVTVKKVKGKHTCALIAAYGGKAEKVVIEGNEGNWAAYDVGSCGGNVGTLLIKDNNGDWAAYEAGIHVGNVGTLLIKDNNGDWAASGVGRYGGKIDTLALYNAGRYAGDGAHAKRIITGKEALKLYKKLEKELI